MNPAGWVALLKRSGKWAATLESRGVSWSQDHAIPFEGEDVAVASNEFTLAVAYLW